MELISLGQPLELHCLQFVGSEYSGADGDKKSGGGVKARRKKT